jgi:hypothetical protein
MLEPSEGAYHITPPSEKEAAFWSDDDQKPPISLDTASWTQSFPGATARSGWNSEHSRNTHFRHKVTLPHCSCFPA